MKAIARIVDGPVTAHAETNAWRASGVHEGEGTFGARARFEGIVRHGEPDGSSGAIRMLEALDYEAYEPMATRALESLVRSMVERHGLHACDRSRWWCWRARRIARRRWLRSASASSC
jgi:molybdopterin synthase catalytic subunit